MNKQSLKSIIIKHRTDIIVIASLLVLSISFLLISTLTRKDGATAVITVGGVTVGEYPLDRNGEYTINNGTNILTVKDGVAYMSYSNCPDHICENTAICYNLRSGIGQGLDCACILFGRGGG